jgi:O-antigen ligase
MFDRLAFAALWLTVFSVPWEDITALPGLDAASGTRASRVLGLAAFGLTLLAVAAAGRLRVPGRFHVLAMLLLLWAAASLLWSIDPTSTVGRVGTYGQLVVLGGMIWQLATTERRQLSLYQAYVLGAYVSAISTMLSYLGGDVTTLRYAAGGFNPNDLGLTLVLAIPMAWHLSLVRRGGALVWLNRLYLPVGTAAVLLTASRSAFISGLIALAIVPWSLPRLRPGARIGAVLLAGVTVLVASTFVPETAWERLGSTRSELATGTLTHRRDIWRAGMLVVREHPLTGVGAGTFPVAAARYLDRPRASHNTYVSLLVELGLVGLGLFVSLLVASLVPIRLMPPPQRRFWLVLACTLVVGLVPRNWDYRKATWFVVASLASEGALLACSRRALAGRRSPRGRATSAVPPPLRRWTAPGGAVPVATAVHDRGDRAS